MESDYNDGNFIQLKSDFIMQVNKIIIELSTYKEILNDCYDLKELNFMVDNFNTGYFDFIKEDNYDKLQNLQGSILRYKEVKER